MPFPSSVRLPLGDWREEAPVVLRPAPAEEVPALPDGDHLLEVDPRRHELVTRRRGASEDLAERADDGAPRDQLDAVLDARLGDTHDEAEVRVGARPEAELVEVERQGRDGRVVADENDLGALEREGAVALRVAAVLADRDPDLGAGGVEDPVARVAVGEVVGLEDLGEPVRGLRAGQVDLAKRPAEASVPVGEERRVEVLSLGFLAEAHVHRDPRLGRAGEERLERLGRHLGLEELVEVGADLLGEVRRERHLRVGDQLDALPRRLGEQTQHPLDDLLAAGALVVGAQLRGGDLYMARHDDSLPFRRTYNDLTARNAEILSGGRLPPSPPSRRGYAPCYLIIEGRGDQRRSARAITIRCTSEGPSPIRRTRASRYQRSSGNSLATP